MAILWLIRGPKSITKNNCFWRSHEYLIPCICTIQEENHQSVFVFSHLQQMNQSWFWLHVYFCFIYHYIHTYICIHICVYTHMHAYIHIYICICMYRQNVPEILEIYNYHAWIMERLTKTRLRRKILQKGFWGRGFS